MAALVLGVLPEHLFVFGLGSHEVILLLVQLAKHLINTIVVGIDAQDLVLLRPGELQVSLCQRVDQLHVAGIDLLSLFQKLGCTLILAEQKTDASKVKCSLSVMRQQLMGHLKRLQRNLIAASLSKTQPEVQPRRPKFRIQLSGLLERPRSHLVMAARVLEKADVHVWGGESWVEPDDLGVLLDCAAQVASLSCCTCLLHVPLPKWNLLGATQYSAKESRCN